MPRHILTLNAGSSSIKYALFDRDALDAPPVFIDQIDGIGVADNNSGAHPLRTHDDAIAEVLQRVQTRGLDITAVGHRIVHGGSHYTAPVLVDDATVEQLAALIPLAPLHQPHNVAGLRAARRAFPKVPQVACFDTAFHATQPALNRRFALPRALHDAGVRRYGFHGLSYEAIVAQLRKSEGALANGRIVVAHLGNGSSMCAIRDGRSVATTMSFSPLDGLPMGTRTGRLDPAVVLHLLREGWSADDIERLLFRESGLLGLSGLSSDLRTLEASTAPDAAFAIDYLVEYALRELAGMVAALRGVDLLVFTGGIGENAVRVRERIVEGCGWMGDVPVRVVKTDEEGVIARHTARVAGPMPSGV